MFNGLNDFTLSDDRRLVLFPYYEQTNYLVDLFDFFDVYIFFRKHQILFRLLVTEAMAMATA